MSAIDTAPLRCPRCGSLQAEVTILTQTVVTLTCPQCRHGWSMNVGSIPDHIRQKIGQ